MSCDLCGNVDEDYAHLKEIDIDDVPLSSICLYCFNKYKCQPRDFDNIWKSTCVAVFETKKKHAIPFEFLNGTVDEIESQLRYMNNLVNNAELALSTNFNPNLRKMVLNYIGRPAYVNWVVVENCVSRIRDANRQLSLDALFWKEKAIKLKKLQQLGNPCIKWRILCIRQCVITTCFTFPRFNQVKNIRKLHQWRGNHASLTLTGDL